jgi:hypothetical protein
VLCAFIFARARYKTVVIPLLLALAFSVVKLREIGYLRPQITQLRAKLATLDSMAGPIVIPEPKPFLQDYFYASPHLRTKLVMPLDERAVLSLTHSDTMLLSYRPLREMPGLSKAMPELAEFLEQHPAFLIFEGLDSSHVWLIPTLLNRGYKITLESETGTDRIYLVSKSAPAS